MPETGPEGADGGLTASEAAERLARDGFNELPARRGGGVWAALLELLREPMLALLFACAAVYLVLGEPREAAVLAAAVAAVAGITLYQERKTEKALEALQDLSSPRALVVRDGRPLRIAGREVVVDDLLILEEGDRVPADATVLAAADLAADESLLTGE